MRIWTELVEQEVGPDFFCGDEEMRCRDGGEAQEERPSGEEKGEGVFSVF